MKRALFLVTILALTAAAIAQEQPTEENNGTDNPKLEYLIKKQVMLNDKYDLKDGFRIQLMYSTDRAEVNKSKARFYKEFPKIRSYIVYEQPYYKLRAGDYSSKLEASQYLEKIIYTFQSSFIVKDRVKKNG